MFPPHDAIVYRNELGEVTGWEPVEGPPPYCDFCGYHHNGDCEEPYDESDIENDENDL
jgi:hypothetical protein